MDPEWVRERDRLRALERKAGLSAGQLGELATLEFLTRPDDATGQEVEGFIDGMTRAGFLERLGEAFRYDPANLEAFTAARRLSPEQEQRMAREDSAESSWPEALPRYSLEHDPDAPAPVADLLGVFYSGKVNWLYGLPGCGKSWLALQVAKELAERGFRVIWIDAEDSLRVFRERLAALGVSPEVLKQIRWVDGDQWRALSDAERQGAIRWLNCPAGHVFIDAAFTTGAGESAESFAEWRKDFLLAEGTTVIDHIPKRREDRPPGPIGSVQKLAAVSGSAVLMVADKGAWTREAPGQAKLILQKDRPGAIGPAMTLAGMAHGTPRPWPAQDHRGKAARRGPGLGRRGRPGSGRGGPAVPARQPRSLHPDPPAGDQRRRQCPDRRRPRPPEGERAGRYRNAGKYQETLSP